MFATTNAAAYDADNCLKNFNSFAVYHNDHLQAALEGLRRAHPRVTVMYADYYQAFMYLLNHAADLGEWLPAMDHRWVSRGFLSLLHLNRGVRRGHGAVTDHARVRLSQPPFPGAMEVLVAAQSCNTAKLNIIMALGDASLSDSECDPITSESVTVARPQHLTGVGRSNLGGSLSIAPHVVCAGSV
ncbi:hypothetical protein BHM03_00013231 [Ensete ventricosum]|nr:hypothetical protein BHM03_00013231 [Ensete ventricosum]